MEAKIMPFFSITKTYKEKVFSFCGIKLHLLRSRYKKAQKFYDFLPEKPVLRDDGLSLVYFLKDNSGEAQVARDFCAALKKADKIFDVSDLNNPNKTYPKFRHKITFSTGLYAKHPIYNETAVLFWEFESGMLQIRPYLFEGLQNVFLFSDFNYNYFKTVAPSSVNLFKVSYPFNFDILPNEPVVSVRKKYGLMEDDFIVFFNFSYFSSYYRKNPEAVLEAFSRALKDKANAKLFIKTQGSEKSPLAGRFLEKVKESGLLSRTVIENKNVSRTEMLNLISSCDVYMSLHRGEGIGLGMLEAMSLGKPVIATNYGGNTDFIKNDVAFPVDYILICPEHLDLKAYDFVEKWAEPNTDQAASFLKTLYESPQLRIEVGAKAKAFVAEHYSNQKFIETLGKIK